MILWRASMQALVTTLSKRKAETFLRVMSARLSQEESMSAVFQIRPTSEHAAVRQARRQAAEIYSRYLPILLAGMPEE